MKLILAGIALLTASPAWSSEQQADVYVSMAGMDTWSGHLAQPAPSGTDGPVASLQRAKELVAEIRRQQRSRSRPIVVSVRGGTYYLNQSLKFEPEDSGTEQSPTIYEAFGDERPVISGGVRVGQWHVTAEGWWQTTLDDVRAGRWSFAQLFVNDQRRYRPRLPKQGDYYYIAGQHGPNQFDFAGDQIRADWPNLSDVEVMLFHDWAASRMRIAAVDLAAHRVLFTGRSSQSFGKGHRYLVENVREALDEPGQWYLDRPLGQLTYIPQTGEQPEQVAVIAPRLDELLALEGDLKNRRWVQYIQFRGLTFAHANWTLPSKGQGFPQAEIGLDAAIVAIGARHIVFDRCSVRHVGGYAMAFGLGSQNNRVASCELVDMGGGGVKIGHAGFGTWDQVKALPSDPEMHVSHHVIEDCQIAHGGRLHPAGIGVWIGQSSDNTVTRNDIFDFYQTGISVGWTWGYGYSAAHHNDISFNHVHTIGQGVLSDMGGVYTLGTQPGTVVHDNHVHDIQSFDYGGWGLYTDEGSSGIVMERNLVHHTTSGGFYQHFGKDNRIQNNIFAFATPIERPKPEPHVSFYFERNIVYWDNDSPLLARCHPEPIPCDINFKLDYNVYWNTNGEALVFPGQLDLDHWRQQSNEDKHSIVANPGFLDAESGNFQLLSNTPAAAIGFQPFDFKKAGRQDPPVLTRDLPQVPPAFR